MHLVHYIHLRIESMNGKTEISLFEYIDRHLNFIHLLLASQHKKQSVDMTLPIMESDGRLLGGEIKILSNTEMFQLQHCINQYSERLEFSRNRTLVTSELKELYQKSKNVIDYFEQSNAVETPFVKNYLKNKPDGNKELYEYFIKHSCIVVALNLYPTHIAYGIRKWNENYVYNYNESLNTIMQFCYKIVTFIDRCFNEQDVLGLPQQTDKPDNVLLQNKHPKIFKNDLGFTLFTKMHELYKEEVKKLQANFSFLYYAMEKDFLNCSQKSYIEFLGSYNIFIDKVDSRQSGTNNKSKLYNSIKERLQ